VSNTAELLLGVIAFSVLVMAAIQVGAIIYAMRAARHVNERVDKLTVQLEQDIKPLLANITAVTSEAAHAANVAARQVDRADLVFGNLVARVDETISTAQQLLKGPARNGVAILSGVQAAVSAYKGMRESSRRRRTMGRAADDEESLFIG
jgi:hypothetical protein